MVDSFGHRLYLGLSRLLHQDRPLPSQGDGGVGVQNANIDKTYSGDDAEVDMDDDDDGDETDDDEEDQETAKVILPKDLTQNVSNYDSTHARLQDRQSLN